MNNNILTYQDMSFQNAANIGKIGEEIVKQIYINKGFEITYNTNQRNIIVDNYDLVATKYNKNKYIEVKTDVKADLTGNVFWELEFNNKPGWTQKYTKESYIWICWVLPISHKLLFLPAKYLYLVDYEKYPKKEASGNSYSAYGYLVPVQELEKIGRVVEYKVMAKE